MASTGQRWACQYPGCTIVLCDKYEIRRHYKKRHNNTPPYDISRHVRLVQPAAAVVQPTPSITPNPPVVQPPPFVPTPAPAPIPDLQQLDMDDAGGRGRREKFPAAKLKEQVTGKVEKSTEETSVMLPSYVASNEPSHFLEQKEVEKKFDHTKTMPNGEKVDFYKLIGPHVESKDRRYYIRAKRDPETFYFHASEAPPYCARLSDENHQQCLAEKTQSCFTKDMMGKTGEWGQYTTRANVFAREGTFCYEGRLLSNNPSDGEHPKIALAASQSQIITSSERGSIRLGFCRREHMWSETLGGNCYSYAFVSHGSNTKDYGNARFNSYMSKVEPVNPGNLKVGDVIGLMITLPPFEVHKKVVEGTFNPVDYPDLECGPGKPTDESKKQSSSKKGGKPGPKPKEGESSKGKEKADGGKKLDVRSQIRANLQPLTGHNLAIEHDILRDRNPFGMRGATYFECPDYTQRPDLMRPATRGQTINPKTSQPYDMDKDAHPNHELAHMRTLPGSKIEVWVNGEYKGILAKNLLAFLPPASYIEKSTRTLSLHGNVDDGQLGYYPALSTYGGGAVEMKFGGKWWYGFENGPPHPDARPFAERYNEQIVDDFVCDLVDEIYSEEIQKDPEWMKKRVLAAKVDAAPVKEE